MLFIIGSRLERRFEPSSFKRRGLDSRTQYQSRSMGYIRNNRWLRGGGILFGRIIGTAPPLGLKPRHLRCCQKAVNGSGVRDSKTDDLAPVVNRKRGQQIQRGVGRKGVEIVHGALGP